MRRYRQKTRTKSNFLNECFKRQADEYINIIFVVSKEPLGAGKSLYAITLAKILDPDYTLKNIFWDPIWDINPSVNDFIKKEDCGIMFDDAQYSIPAKNHMNKDQRKFIKKISICRPAGVDIIITTPTFGGVDKDLRRLATFLIDMSERGVGEVSRVVHDVKKDKITFDEMETLTLPMPHEKVVKAYLKLRRKHVGVE